MEEWIDVSNMTIEEAYYEMKYREENGEHVRCRKSGHEFHSNNVTLDDMYRTITGMTQEEFRKESAKQLYADKLNRVRTQEKIPGWLNRGRRIIYYENHNAWEFCVSKMASSSYYGKPIEIALDIMEAIDRGEALGAVAKMLNSDDQRMNSLVERIVFSYSKKGPEFLEYIRKDNLTAQDLVAIEKQKAKNKEYKIKEQDRKIFGK